MAPAAGPLTFAPILKERVWGGRRLAAHGVVLPDDGAAVGEAWILADLPDSIQDGRSTIETGAGAGQRLDQWRSQRTAGLLGTARPSPDGRFPLLVKLLDARENLSVQVHPTAEYVRDHPDTHVKSEAWIILEAAPGAVIYKGLRRPLDREQIREAARSGAIVDELHAIPVQPGDCHYLPSGTVHALGAGLVVAEVQTPSDTTFRLFDWGRTGRTLQIEDALSCMLLTPDDATRPSTPPIRGTDVITTPLVRTPDFDVDRLDATSPHAAPLPLITSGRPVVLLPLSAPIELVSGDEVARVPAGRAALLPAELDGWSLRPASGPVLRIDVPGPESGAAETSFPVA